MNPESLPVTAAPLTFLFTDIEGSTRRWEAEPEAMAPALARHDALLRAAIESRGGHVFKTVGDAFCAAFDSAPDALFAALQAQRALAEVDWSAFGDAAAGLRVRMAVHTGLAEARDGDYFGPTLNRVARLLATGHGGQVLVSRVAEELAHRHLAPGLRLRDLGEHRLKDLDRAERVFQLDPDPAPDGWPIAFPPLRTPDAVPGNLPIQLSSFVGREREIAALRELVSAHRLVAVTGAGGSGKTRLALQVAADCADAFVDGAWFVDLAPRSGDDAVASAAAAAIGIREDPARPAQDVVVDYLADRRALVLLDNCEHVIADAAAFAAAILARCPGVRVLATSREPLGLSGEHRMALAPLDLPPLLAAPPDDDALAHLRQFDAVRLFIERAAAADPAFAVGPGNAAPVAEICHRLDGIPLAIELAAARARTLAPADIARRLGDRFRLLTGGARDRLPRQQTLQAAIDWSYDLLPDVERRVLERFSVFAGAVPMAAAEAVCAGDGVAEGEVLDAMDALVAKSLLVPRDVRGETWFAMLETVREYALVKLVDGGGMLWARSRHLDWYLRVADEAGIVRYGADMDRWMERLLPIADDLLAMIDWWIATAEAVEHAGRAVDEYWWLLERASSPRAIERLMERLIAALERRGVALCHPRTLWFASWTILTHGLGHGGIALAEQALPAARLAGDIRLTGWIHQNLALAHQQRGDFDATIAHLEQAIATKQGLDDSVELSICFNHVGEVHRERNDAQRAMDHYARAIQCLAESDRTSSIAAWPIHNIGQLLLERQEFGSAERVLRLALATCVGYPSIAGSTLAGLAGIAALSGDGPRAARLLGASASILEQHGIQLQGVDEASRQSHEAIARALLAPERWDTAFAEGHAETRSVMEDELAGPMLAAHEVVNLALALPPSARGSAA